MKRIKVIYFIFVVNLFVNIAPTRAKISGESKGTNTKIIIHLNIGLETNTYIPNKKEM